MNQRFSRDHVPARPPSPASKATRAGHLPGGRGAICQNEAAPISVMLTRFLGANRCPPSDQVRGHASLEDAWLRGERFRLRMREEGHRLEAVVAGPALPEIAHATRPRLDPFRNGDRFAALGAGIFPRQGADFCSRHGASPFSFMYEGELDRTAVGYRRFRGSHYRARNRAIERQSVIARSGATKKPATLSFRGASKDANPAPTQIQESRDSPMCNCKS
jgi:hypothetical protein